MSAESARLRERGAATWAAAIAHPMVAEIGAGTLPHSTFRFYFEQNVQYLQDYVRAIAFTIGGVSDRAVQATLSRFLGQIVEVEIPANLDFLSRLGGDPDRLPKRLPTNSNYSAHLLSTARGSDLAVSLAALLPCQWSYGEIGQQLVKSVPADPVYADWIAMFAGDGYDDLVRASTDLLDAACTPAHREATAAAFDESTRYELAFWEMAYTLGRSDDAH